MSEQVWYLFQGGQQIGPFDSNQVVQLHTNNMIAQESYVFKVGWKEWRPIEDIYEELGIKAGVATMDKAKEIGERRAAAPRATVAGSVIVHNNGQICIGNGVNISVTGIFVETRDQIFTVGETLSLTVRCDGLGKPFNVKAKVIRFTSQPPYPTGYGLQFEGLEEGMQERIGELIQKQNRKENKVAGTFV
ncbi:MAG: PilZ domain-containing protein [Oligoflexales bacterium]